MYTVLISKQVSKFIASRNVKENQPLKGKIESLRKNPYSSDLDIKKLTIGKNQYRLRIGKYRLIYRISN